jgi:circadian clock protein KaiC
MLTLMYMSPVGLYIDEFVNRVSQKVLADGSQRVLIDSINDLQVASDEDRYRDFMYALMQHLAVNGVSAFMTHEVGDLFSTTVLSRYGISQLSDNVLLLSYVRDDSEIKRAISVIKTRASAHDPGIRQFTISSEGITVGEAFAGSRFKPAQR